MFGSEHGPRIRLIPPVPGGKGGGGGLKENAGPLLSLSEIELPRNHGQAGI